MANKWFGKIGFSDTAETEPGIWEEIITEKFYYGDVLRRSMKWQSTQELNDDVLISNQISILADDYATANLGKIRYVEYMGSLWKISDISVEYPRLVLSIGGVYNA